MKVVSFIGEYLNRSTRNEVYKRKYKNLIRHIENFEEIRNKSLYLSDLNANIAEEFIYYLKSSGRLKDKEKGAGLMLNTVRAIKHSLNAVLRRAKASGYSINVDFFDVEVRLEEVASIYLTMDEISKINDVILQDGMASVRDVFIVGCFTGMRFSDYSQLTRENIVNGRIEMKTRKTGAKVIIPIHPVIRDILEQNNGDFPKIKSEQSFNKSLKLICKKAGIDNEIIYERTIGMQVVRKRVKKYELVSSHTARRSCATNMYLSGIPVARIMLITGHTTEQSFFNYIRIGKEDNADVLAKHYFFSGF